MSDLSSQKFNVEEIVPSYKSETKRIIKLFIPIIIGQVAQSAMSVVDTVMASWAGVEDLSGVAIGGSFFIPSLLFIVGMSLAIQPTLAQLRGANQIDKIPLKMHNAFVVCFITSLLVMVFLYLSPKLYSFMDDIDENMVYIATGYLKAVALGMPGFALFNVLRGYCEGMGNTTPTLIFGFVALFLNIPLNYIFIFGHFGLPAYGGIGCGIATSLTIYITSFIFYIYIQRAKFFAGCRVLRAFYKVTLYEVKSFLRLGLPIGLSTTIEALCFALVSFMLSPFGPVIVGAHSIVLNITYTLYVIPLSLGTCATIRVGEAMGLLHWNRAFRTISTVLIIGYTFFVIYLILTLLFTENIAAFYSSDKDVQQVASELIFLCALYMFPETIMIIGVGILRGFKDSKTIFYVTTISYWVICMPIGFTLANGLIDGNKMAAHGYWIGFIAGVFSAGTAYAVRLLYLYKKRIVPSGMREM